MTFEKIVLNLMCFSRNTFYVWKREKRPIIKLLIQYFTTDEVQEFLETGKITKLELIRNITKKELAELIDIKNNQVLLNEIEIKKKEIKELENKMQ